VQFGHCGEEKKLLPLPDIEPWFLSCSAQSLVTVPMEELSHTIFMQSILLIIGLSMTFSWGLYHMYAVRRSWARTGTQGGTKPIICCCTHHNFMQSVY
jgi:hypothetical protein